jgi:hypothetical protein
VFFDDKNDNHHSQVLSAEISQVAASSERCLHDGDMWKPEAANSPHKAIRHNE